MSGSAIYRKETQGRYHARPIAPRPHPNSYPISPLLVRAGKRPVWGNCRRSPISARLRRSIHSSTVRSRLVSRRTAKINQFRAFLIEQGIAVRAGPRARKSLFAILDNRKEEISPRTARLIRGLYDDWCWLDEHIETVTGGD
jgi:transposase